jgi:hypothetical protein
VAATVFTFATRRIRPGWTFALAGIVIAVLTIALQAIIAASGLHFELDGP